MFQRYFHRQLGYRMVTMGAAKEILVDIQGGWATSPAHIIRMHVAVAVTRKNTSARTQVATMGFQEIQNERSFQRAIASTFDLISMLVTKGMSVECFSFEGLCSRFRTRLRDCLCVMCFLMLELWKFHITRSSTISYF